MAKSDIETRLEWLRGVLHAKRWREATSTFVRITVMEDLAAERSWVEASCFWCEDWFVSAGDEHWVADMVLTHVFEQQHTDVPTVKLLNTKWELLKKVEEIRREAEQQPLTETAANLIEKLVDALAYGYRECPGYEEHWSDEAG